MSGFEDAGFSWTCDRPAKACFPGGPSDNKASCFTPISSGHQRFDHKFVYVGTLVPQGSSGLGALSAYVDHDTQSRRYIVYARDSDGNPMQMLREKQVLQSYPERGEQMMLAGNRAMYELDIPYFMSRDGGKTFY